MNKETKIGYIYSLTCCNPSLVYYGSTTRQLNERLSKHKYDFKNNKSVSSKILFEWGNIKINMLEQIEYENRQELRDREAYYIKNLECVNKKIPNRTKKEYSKKYYSDNKGKIKEEQQKYYSDNKEKIKKYKLENKDKIKEYQKQYRLENIDELNLKITCECGSEYTKTNYARHCKSKKHLQYIENSNIKL